MIGAFASAPGSVGVEAGVASAASRWCATGRRRVGDTGEGWAGDLLHGGRRCALARLTNNGHVMAVGRERPALFVAPPTLMNWAGRSREVAPSLFSWPGALSLPWSMTREKSAGCVRLSSAGQRPAEMARQQGVPGSTLRRAIRRQCVPGRLCRETPTRLNRRGARVVESGQMASPMPGSAPPVRVPTSGSRPRRGWPRVRRRTSKRTTMTRCAAVGRPAGLVCERAADRPE